MGDGTKADTEELAAAADALVGIRSQLRQKDNEADDETRAAGTRINKTGGRRTPHGLVAFADRWPASPLLPQMSRESPAAVAPHSVFLAR